MELRKYLETDADEIIKWIIDERALRLWSFNIYGDYPIKAEDINNNYNKCISSSNFYPMTLVDDGKIVGHLILRNPDSNKTNIVRLGFIIVDSSIRGKGYGKILIKEAIKYAKTQLNATEINLGVFANNESAYHCYKSVGFKETQFTEDVFRFQEEKWDYFEMVLEN